MQRPIESDYSNLKNYIIDLNIYINYLKAVNPLQRLIISLGKTIAQAPDLESLTTSDRAILDAYINIFNTATALNK